MMISMILGGIQQNSALAKIQSPNRQNSQNDHQSQIRSQRLNFDPKNQYGPHLPDQLFREINENQGLLVSMLSNILLECSMVQQYIKSTLTNKILKNTRIGWYGEDDTVDETVLTSLITNFESQAIYKNSGIGWYGEDDTVDEDTPLKNVNIVKNDRPKDNAALLLKKITRCGNTRTFRHQLRRIVGEHTNCVRSV